MTNMSYMIKMKNYLTVPMLSNVGECLASTSVSVSFREIMRLKENFLANGSSFKVVRVYVDDDGELYESDDLVGSKDQSHFNIRSFSIVEIAGDKSSSLTKNKK